MTLAARFDELVRLDAGRTAVQGASRSFTYGELSAASGRLATEILERGNSGSVLLMTDQAATASALFIAADRLDVPVVPVHRDWPARRLEHVARVTGASLVCHDEFRLEPTSGGDYQTRTGALAGVAYIMFTSGSTGEPKGVVVPRADLLRRLYGLQTRLTLSADDRWLSLTDFTFDISVAEILLPCLTGGTIIDADAGHRRDPDLFCALLRATQPSIVQATPSTWRIMIAGGWTGDRTLRLLSGGEELSVGLSHDLRKRSGELWNLYGPTEAVIWATAQRVDEGYVGQLGQPLDGTELELDGEAGRQLKGTIPGQIVLRGPLASGYLGDQALTDSRFLTDDRGPLYLTGDIGERLEDGGVVYRGRRDGQIKLRGHRIELEEISRSIERHPDVVRALTALAFPDQARAQLVSFIIGQGPIDTAELKSWIRDTLPDHMIPVRIEQLGDFPTTTAGKADGRQLLENYYALRRAEVGKP